MRKRNWFWGLFFIAAAVLLIVGKLGMVGGVNLWSLMLTVLFAATLIKSVAGKSVSGVLFSIAFLCIVWDETLGITELTPWTVLGAALLLSIGISFFYHPKRYHHTRSLEEEGFDDIETVEDEEMEVVTKFGGSIKYVNSEDFRCARVEAVCAGVKLYLDNAVIRGDQAALHVQLSFAGVELYVPKSWKIVDQTNVMMGGVEEKNNRNGLDEKRLILTGEIRLSGITVIYV